MSKYVGAIDQGTSSTRFLIFDRRGAIVGSAQKEHQQIYPKPGWVEHDAAEIWRNTVSTISEALRSARVTPSDLVSVGITNQRETVVLWDRLSGEPLANAIVWQDTRTDNLVAELCKDGGQDRLRAKTGLPLSTYFSGLKLRWLLENVPGARAKAEAGDALFGTVDSWLAWNLTGGPDGGLHITDATNASRTQMMDLATLAWNDELLALFGVPRACLPEIKSSSQLYGEAKGVLAGVPIGGILGDQQAALFGQACLKPGEAKNTYGTGCFMLMHTGGKPIASKNKLLTTVAWRLGDRTEYALEGSIFIAGAVVQWLRDGLGIIKSSGEIEALAAQVADNGGVYLVPALAGLGAPHWDACARGLIIGLTRGTTRAHIARAALEGIALQVADVLHAMENDAGIRLKELRVDGGASVNNLLMQFQADLLGVPVVRPCVAETTALGAAYLAGLGVGFWKDQREIAAHWKADRRFIPAIKPALRKQLLTGWTRALARAKNWSRSLEQV